MKWRYYNKYSAIKMLAPFCWNCYSHVKNYMVPIQKISPEFRVLEVCLFVCWSYLVLFFLLWFIFRQVKEKKTHIRTPKPPFIDFSPFKSSTVRMLIICSSIASFGSYGPLFFMSQHGFLEGYDVQDLVLLQTFLGLSIAFGIVASGSTINKNFTIAYRKINISRQFVCQVSIKQTIFPTLFSFHLNLFLVLKYIK